MKDDAALRAVVQTAWFLPYCLTFSMLVAESLTGALAGLKNNSVVRKLIMAQKKSMYNTYLDIESLNTLISNAHKQRPFVLT